MSGLVRQPLGKDTLAGWGEMDSNNVLEEYYVDFVQLARIGFSGGIL
jgi:hypothetical protein